MKAQAFAATLLLTVAACKAPDVPRSPAPWITLGASNNIVTSLDTSRIVLETGTRVVWIRQTEGVRTAPDAPATSTVKSESRHRINCGTRVVTDLGAAGDSAGAPQPFAEHPYGKRVFGTVCNALGNLPARESRSGT
ncbi:MAG TPA: hypothetical protein VF710_17535 [Longimicrobium sp.]|jgi:hypothetical protein